MTAVDLEVVPKGLDLHAYWTMLRLNGVQRVVRSIGRRMLGADRRCHKALVAVLDASVSWPRTYAMDAQDLTFSDGTFDGAFSFAVFQSLEHPRRALRELKRVVKDDGVIYVALELFSSITGSHDPRLWSDIRALPLWAHLRPSCAGLWHPNVYINRLRMIDIERIARDELRDARFFYEEHGSRKYLAELGAFEREELSDYTDAELCTQDLVILGRARS
jgi:SAM-dependent methyltransferase